MKKMLVLLLTLICLTTCLTSYAAPPCDDSLALANALHEFGLFNGKGTDNNGSPIYDLESAPTRQEALVMLIRLLGKENVALNSDYSHPFDDVDVWADKYVAYAYNNSITNGVSATAFGAKENISAQQYITFLLRALGYSDSQGDFSYNEAFDYSNYIGLTEGRYSQGETFLRGDVVWLSCGALLQNTKTGTPLVKQLKNEKVISEKQYNNGLYLMAIADLAESYRNEHFNGEYFDMYDLYVTEGMGNFQGYQRLHGYPKDDEFHIYFKDSNHITVYHNIDTSQVITWKYKGNTYKNTIAECYAFFADTEKLRDLISDLGGEPSELLLDTFGDVYFNWVCRNAYASKGTTIVNKYLNIQNGIYYEEPRGGLFPEEYFGLFDFNENYTEQTLTSEWVNEFTLKTLTGDSRISFYGSPESNGTWVYRFGLTGYSSTDLCVIWDMPESFATSENATGTYNGIRFKRENGEWYFNPNDLIAIGLINEDGTLNENFKNNQEKPSEIDPSLSLNQEWITQSDLERTYGVSSIWLGDKILLTKKDWNTNKEYKYEITGTPSSSFKADEIYVCECDGVNIEIRYVSEIEFKYKDLLELEIVGLQ